MLEFLFDGSLFLDRLCFPLFLLLLEIVDLLLEHLDVQLQLLLHLDVVTHLRLIVLQLLLVLLRWQVQRVERGGELARGPIVHVEAARSVVPASARIRCIFLLFEPELH